MRWSLRRARPRLVFLSLLAAPAAVAATAAQALDGQRADVAGFIAEMADRHGFDPAVLGNVFTQVESRPAIIEAMSRPAEKTMPWHEYRARFITERRIQRGHDTALEQSAALAEAARASGVPCSVLLAIAGVETFYGERTGTHRVIDALATLAFDYPARSRYFRGELEQFLLMARDEAIDPLVPLGSYAGAMGIPQFMPTSFRSYAVDGGGDGHRDLWRDWNDVFASIGNYLKLHGWRTGEPVMVTADVSEAKLEGVELTRLDLTETVESLRTRGVRFDTGLPPDAGAVLIELAGSTGPEYRVGFANFHAITRYNRSALYASAVSDLAEALAAEPAPPAGTAEPGALPPAPTAAPEKAPEPPPPAAAAPAEPATPPQEAPRPQSPAAEPADPAPAPDKVPVPQEPAGSEAAPTGSASG